LGHGSSNHHSKPINYILDQVWIDQQVDADADWNKNQEPISQAEIPRKVPLSDNALTRDGFTKKPKRGSPASSFPASPAVTSAALGHRAGHPSMVGSWSGRSLGIEGARQWQRQWGASSVGGLIVDR
jgi:hypothetical protein